MIERMLGLFELLNGTSPTDKGCSGLKSSGQVTFGDGVPELIGQTCLKLGLA